MKTETAAPMPQPIPRAEFDRVACLWDVQQAAESAFSEAWNAIPTETRRRADFDAENLGVEIQALSAKRDETKRQACLAMDGLERSFPWFSARRVDFSGITAEQFEAGIVEDFKEALQEAWKHSRRDRLAALIAVWNPLKGSETVNPPVSGWALSIRTQQAFKILRASPTGRKVRAVGVDGVVCDLKPSVVHGSAVGSGRAGASTGGWVSCSESLCEEVWALRRDRDEFFAAHPAIV